MTIEIKVPPLGESVSNAEIASWLVADGDYVNKNQEVVEIDSDKATLAVSAEEAGVIRIKVIAGSKVNIGDIIALVEPADAPVTKKERTDTKDLKPIEKVKSEGDHKNSSQDTGGATIVQKVNVSPLASSMIADHGLDINAIITDKMMRITKTDVEHYLNSGSGEKKINRNEVRKEMSALRKKLSERLVRAKNESAMLTTFNEVDMTGILEARQQFGKSFQDKYGIKLGFMSFFTRAVCIALEEMPELNASIEGDEIVYHDYKDIGIAVSSPKGLVVPVLRNAEVLDLRQIETGIADLAEKARNKKLSIEDMNGGTFTISNGGVFGSLLSTPIINPPQVAILGMHKIQERPAGIEGRIELRPMMYIALSYDHRIIDGREAVTFLVRCKELLENPSLLASGKHPVQISLGL